MRQYASTYYVLTHTLDPWGGVKDDPWEGSKVKTIIFLKVIMLHIKLIGMESRATHNHIFCPYTHPLSLGLGQKINIYFFLKVPCHVAYPIKGNGA